MTATGSLVLERLTPRPRQILATVCDGMANKDIAAQLRPTASCHALVNAGSVGPESASIDDFAVLVQGAVMAPDVPPDRFQS
jgi:hypothetical protein